MRYNTSYAVIHTMADDIFLTRPRKKKKKKISGFVVEEEGDHPVHEDYAREEPVKEG